MPTATMLTDARNGRTHAHPAPLITTLQGLMSRRTLLRSSPAQSQTQQFQKARNARCARSTSATSGTPSTPLHLS